MIQQENKQHTDKREVNISAIVPSWVDDAIRRIAFEKRISRSVVVSDILVRVLADEDPDSEQCQVK